MQSQNQQVLRNAYIGSLMVLVAAVTVSSKAIFVKLAYAYSVDPATLIALRMAFSAPFFIGLALWARASATAAKISRRDGWMIIAAGMLGGYGPMWLDFAGLAYVSAGLERIVLFLYPTMVVMLTAILFKQRITRRELFALVLTYAGVGLVVSHDLKIASLGGSQTMLGIALVFASAITYAAYLVFSGRLIPRVGSSLFTAYTMLAATAASAGHFAATQHQTVLLHLPTQVYLLSLAMALVATVLPAILLNAGIQRIGSNKASLVASVGPVSTIFLAYIFLAEDITSLQLFGTGLVMTGVWVIARHK